MEECCEKRKYIDEKVLDFFNGDKARFQQWLLTPNPSLGNITPMQTSVNALYKFVKEAMDANGDDKECMGCQ